MQLDVLVKGDKCVCGVKRGISNREPGVGACMAWNRIRVLWNLVWALQGLFRYISADGNRERKRTWISMHMR
jgi:hypothetical protein